MDPERWQKIADLFEVALHRDADARPGFLADSCAGDDGLRQEVEALLASHEQANHFIEEPAILVAAKQASCDTEPSLIGRTIGHYRVVNLLGAGGMGEVYLAEDTRLGRRVALKLLPDVFTDDSERAQRFRQEARAASALNQTNIIVIHDIGEAAGRHYIAMEFVEGETLRARLARAPLELPEALVIATQVAAALAAAHAAGIVHRDVKPENVMLRGDGVVKVLDFGIAKLGTDAGTPGPWQAPAMFQHQTSPGMILGTVSYMSPEQARAKDVDNRADIWSLGCVLYEMIAGRAPFEGETAAAVISSILHKEPHPLVRLGTDVPAELQQIVTKALKKDRAARYQNVEDFAQALKMLLRELERSADPEFSASPNAGRVVNSTFAREVDDTTRESQSDTSSGNRATAAIVPQLGKGWAIGLLAAAIVTLLLLGFFAIRFFNSRPANLQPQAAAPNLKITRLTPELNAFADSFTPDGKYAVFVQLDKGKKSVWLKDLTTGAATLALPADEGGYEDVQFSRDGNWIYYATVRPNKPNKTLVRVPSAGGMPEEIAFNLVSPVAFSPDDRQIAFINGDHGDLHVAGTDGERVLSKVDPKKGWFESWGSNLSWSSVHNLIAICGGRYGAEGKPHFQLLLINPADGAEQVVPTPQWNYLDDVRWLGDGSALIVAARETEASPYQLWRVSYPDGATRRITTDLDSYASLAISPDSRRILTNRYLAQLNLWLAPADGRARVRQISFGSAAKDGTWGMAFTPDGKIIYTSPRGGAIDLWQMNADGGEPKQLTKNAGPSNAQPRITPDGKTIVFASTRSGRSQIWRMDADGGNAKQLTNEFWAGEPSLSPDGSEIYFKIDDGDKGYISKISLDGGQTLRVSKTPHSVGSPVVSPDGKSLLCGFYDRDAVQPWKSGILDAVTGELVRVFDFHVGIAAWTADSKSIIYHVRHNANLWRFSLEANARPQQITEFDDGEIRNFAISTDFRQLVISRGAGTYEALLLENF
jgi:serine/threonine protein kinase/Tol biopolymer transport system component